MDNDNTATSDNVSPASSNSLLGSAGETNGTSTDVTNEVTNVVAPEATASSTFSMDDFRGILDDDIKDSATWGKFKDVKELGKSYTELEKLVGKKGDIPSAEATPEEWNSFYGKIGRPETTEGYDTVLPDSIAHIEGAGDRLDKVKSIALESNLTKEQANKFFGAVMEMEAADAEEHYQALDRQHAENEATLKAEWGNGFDQMASEVQALEQRLGVFDAFEAAGLNANPILLMALGKIAKDLGETSTIETAIASTPVGVENEVAEINSKVQGFLREGNQVPEHLTARLNELYSKMG